MRAERGEGRRQQQVRGRREREPLWKAGKMLCLKKRRTYSFTQGARNEAPRRSRKRSASAKGDAKQQQSYSETVATLPRKITPREERSSAMVLTVTEDTPADMLAGSMELLVQMPRDHHVQMQRVTVQRSTPMMDLLVQIATAHKLAASSYTLQAIGERDLVLPHQPNTPIGALDALQVKLLPKQGTFLPRKSRQPNQPFETTFRLQVHLPRNQLYVSRVSPKTNLGEILDEVCREKNLDRNKYELRHPANLSEPLDLSLSLQDYHLQEVTLCPRQPSRAILGSALSSQDIMALQKQEECRRQQARHSVFNFMFKKSKESSLSTDSLGNRSVSPAHSDETARSNSPVHHIQQQQIVQPPPPPARPQRKRRPAPKPPTLQVQQQEQTQRTTVSKSASETSSTTTTADKDKVIISHSRNSSDSSGYHEASVLSDNPDNGRMPETLPRRGRMQGILEAPRKLAHTSQASKSLGNLAVATSHGGTLSRGISNTSLSSAGQRKKRAAPAPPMARPLPSAISAQGLERIVDSDESLTSDMDLSKPSSDIGVTATGASSKASSDIACHAVHSIAEQPEAATMLEAAAPPPPAPVEPARVVKKEPAPPVPKPRKVLKSSASTSSLASSVDSPVLETPPRLSSNSPTPSAEVASFGLPSLTEDEREEIAMAIDSIVEAAQGHDDTESSVYEDAQSERRTSEGWDDGEEVFIDSVPMVCIEGPQDQETGESTCLKIPIEKIQVPLAFRDPEDLDVEKIEVQHEETEKKDSDLKEESKQVEDATNAEPVTSSQSSDIKAPSNPSPTDTAKEVKFELSDGPSCAVISTIPKCDHLEPYTDSDFGLESLNSNDSGSSNTTTSKKRGKVVRSQSEMSHFEFGPAEKHGRHLTSNGEAFTFALNPNLGEAAQRSIEATIAGAGKAAPTDTDILLQKVSDTLSHSLTPPSPPPTPEDASLEVPNFAISNHSQPPKGFESEPRTDDAPVADSTVDSTGPKESKAKQEEEEVTSTLSANNLTLSSQQDTSDYVSASGEDLSIGDWEYQIPAPPSAFRDDESQATAAAAAAVAAATEKQTDVPTIKELIAIEAEVHHTTPENPPKAVAPSTAVTKESASQPKSTKPVVEEPLRQHSKTEITVDAVDFCPSKTPKIITSQISNNSSTEVKKAEVISELETKINSKKPIVEPPKDESDAPKIAPVENNLSNFTITTYSRQKSLDIFEQMDQHQHNQTRVLSTFATLTRGRSSAADFVEEKNGLRSGLMKNAQSMERVSMPLVEERVYFAAERNEIVRDKPSVHRSQSYIVLSSNEKFQNRTNEVGKNKDEKYTIAADARPNYELNNSSKKFTSLANVNSTTNEVPRHKEKFSQWRENILRKHEEPSKEKQLQSLQVLKSILPQLKNAQANEENGYKSDNFNTKKRQETHQDEVPDSSMVSTSARSEIQMRASNSRRNQEPAKRYTYGGPPSVSLGSWSERPSVNVQIKTDTDYKFGSKNSASGARTVVSLNSGDRIQNGGVAMERKEPVNVVEKEKEREEEPRVDTTSVNFRELTKAFGQAEVRMRPKPPIVTRNPQQRHSEYIERPKVEIAAPKQNGFADSHVSSTTSPFGVNHVKRYTSVIGINNSNNNNNNNNNNTSNININNKSHASFRQQTNFSHMNGQAIKPPPPPPVTAKPKEFSVPKPPTMPIITGVTLKSVNARPKSCGPTIQADPRDQLLESIRNFGGRNKLKSTGAAERY